MKTNIVDKIFRKKDVEKNSNIVDTENLANKIKKDYFLFGELLDLNIVNRDYVYFAMAKNALKINLESLNGNAPEWIIKLYNKMQRGIKVE